MFHEGDMHGVENDVSGVIPESICLRVWGISDQGAGE
jgi:hypothetical protein